MDIIQLIQMNELIFKVLNLNFNIFFLRNNNEKTLIITKFIFVIRKIKKKY